MVAMVSLSHISMVIRPLVNVVVDGATTDSVTIGQLTLGMILRDVDDEVELVVDRKSVV